MEVQFKTYKVIKGFYNEKKEIEIVLPEGLKMTYKDGAVGPGGCFEGHNHYIGFIRNSDYPDDIRDQIYDKNHWVHTEPFDDLTIVYIDDIKPIDELPVYTSEEMMEEFGLRDYFVVCEKLPKYENLEWKKLWDDAEGDVNKLAQVILDTQLNRKVVIPGKVYEIYKIQDIQGPYDCKAFNIMVGNYFDDRPTYVIQDSSLEIVNHCEDLFSSKHTKYIKKNAHELFEQLKNEVLSQIK
jgi:hypothetical protein